MTTVAYCIFSRSSSCFLRFSSSFSSLLSTSSFTTLAFFGEGEADLDESSDSLLRFLSGLLFESSGVVLEDSALSSLLPLLLLAGLWFLTGVLGDFVGVEAITAGEWWA